MRMNESSAPAHQAPVPLRVPGMLQLFNWAGSNGMKQAERAPPVHCGIALCTHYPAAWWSMATLNETAVLLPSSMAEYGHPARDCSLAPKHMSWIVSTL